METTIEGFSATGIQRICRGNNWHTKNLANVQLEYCSSLDFPCRIGINLFIATVQQRASRLKTCVTKQGFFYLCGHRNKGERFLI